MATSDKLQDLIDIKQDIKEAIENKDVDMTGVAFAGYAGKIDEIETGGGGGGLTGGYNVIYRSNELADASTSITLTFVDDTTASYEINTLGTANFPSDWEHYTGEESSYSGHAPYVWNNVKSVSITAHPIGFNDAYIYINNSEGGTTYNETLDKNILVSQSSSGG